MPKGVGVRVPPPALIEKGLQTAAVLRPESFERSRWSPGVRTRLRTWGPVGLHRQRRERGPMTYDEQRRKYVVRWRENGRRRVRRFDTPEQAQAFERTPRPRARRPRSPATRRSSPSSAASPSSRPARHRGRARRRAWRRRLPLRDQAGHPLRLQVPPERPQLEHPPRLHQPARRPRRQTRARGVHPPRRGQGRARELRGLLEPLPRRAQALPDARHYQNNKTQGDSGCCRTSGPSGSRRSTRTCSAWWRADGRARTEDRGGSRPRRSTTRARA